MDEEIELVEPVYVPQVWEYTPNRVGFSIHPFASELCPVVESHRPFAVCVVCSGIA